MELCDYGCGKESKFYFKNGKKCCSKSVKSCPTEKMKNNKTKTRNKRLPLENLDQILCHFGCNQVGRYKNISNGNWCCSENVSQCQINKIKNTTSRLNDLGAIKTENPENILCEYGCGKVATHQFKSGKWCCGEHYMKCPINKVVISKNMKDRKYNIEWRNNISKSLTGRKLSKEHSEKLKSCRIGPRPEMTLSLNQVKERNPWFLDIEDLKQDSETGKLMGRCKYSECENSKEKDGWFILKPNQFSNRLGAILNKDGSYFYCSNKCKERCDLFNIRTDPVDKPNSSCITQKDYNTFRDWVLKKDEYRCFYCGKPAEFVHHEVPQIIDPGQTLDPPNGISFCFECHDKYGHKKGTECSTGNLGMGRSKFET